MFSIHKFNITIKYINICYNSTISIDDLQEKMQKTLGNN